MKNENTEVEEWLGKEKMEEEKRVEAGERKTKSGE